MDQKKTVIKPPQVSTIKINEVSNTISRSPSPDKNSNFQTFKDSDSDRGENDSPDVLQKYPFVKVNDPKYPIESRWRQSIRTIADFDDVQKLSNLK